MIPQAAAQPPAAAVLAYNPGSSVKLEQIIGDCDWQYLDWSSGRGTCKPTASQTGARFHILGNGGGYTFEDKGKFIHVSGDTVSTEENTYKFRAGDTIGFSTATDGESPLVLNYYMDSTVTLKGDRSRLVSHIAVMANVRVGSPHWSVG